MSLKLMYIDDVANLLPKTIGPTFEIGKRYVRVYMQQGRVVTDDDFNEKTEISKKLFSAIRKNIDSFERHIANCKPEDESNMNQFLLETWGKIAESLSAYQDRIGNESYLIDTKKGIVHFGDGIKGKKLPQENTIRIQYVKGSGISDNKD